MSTNLLCTTAPGMRNKLKLNQSNNKNTPELEKWGVKNPSIFMHCRQSC